MNDAGAHGDWPLRLLVVGKFSNNRGHDGGRLHSVHDINSLIASLNPCLGPDDGVPCPLRFRQLDDFHIRRVRDQLIAAQIDIQATALDDLLHANAFQALESSWRGLALLLAGSEGQAEIQLLDIDEQAFRVDPVTALRAACPTDPRHLLTAVLIDVTARGSPKDGQFFQALASFGACRRIPIILPADASVFGTRHAAHVPAIPDPSDRLDATWGGTWRQFRQSDEARWICATFNRFLLRAPYNDAEDGHAESTSAASPGSFLWGSGIWLAGLDLIRSSRAHGHPLALTGITPERAHTGFAKYGWSATRGPQESALEAQLDMAAAYRLLRAGVTPVLELYAPGSCSLPLLATVFRPDPQIIPAEGTLAYTILTARLVAVLAEAASSVGREPNDEAASRELEKMLVGALAPVFGDDSRNRLESAVTRESGQRVASATIRCELPNLGREVELGLSIPLAGGPDS